MSEQVLEQLWERWPRPQIDAFATCLNHRLPTILLPSAGPTGTSSGRTVSTVGRPPSVPVPSDSTHSVSSPQAGPTPSRTSGVDSAQQPGCPVVPPVVGSHKSSRSRVRSTPSKGRSSNSTHLRETSSQRKESQLSRLETLKVCWEKRGSSELVAAKLAESKAKGTNAVYNARWRIYALWCHEHNPPLNPTEVRTKHVLEFLNFLLDSKKPAVSTFEGYISALKSVFKYCSRAYILNSTEVKDLVQFLKLCCISCSNLTELEGV